MGIRDWFRKVLEDDIPQNPHVPKAPTVAPITAYDPNKPTMQPGNATLPNGDKLIAPVTAQKPIVPLKDILAATSKHNFNGRRIGIIVGHEKKRPGAVLQFGKLKGTPEYAYNSVVARMLAKDIVDAGGKSSIHFRDTLGIRGAYLEADKLDCDFIIELHFNSSADERASGVETLISTSNPYSDVSKLEMRFAICFADEIHAIGGNVVGRKRGGNGVLQVRKEDRGGQNVHTLQNTPTVLIEPFFGSNAASCEVFGSLRGQEKIAEAIFSALGRTFNV